ncbi:MAG: hypothetical protein K5705_00040 [Oscillospiraceae bacterium]|nr:hypothetical protein [Oscillospiraceae bacterium]
MTYNDIGIESTLDRQRIRKLFMIGQIGGCMPFVGGLLLTMRLAQREKR